MINNTKLIEKYNDLDSEFGKEYYLFNLKTDKLFSESFKNYIKPFRNNIYKESFKVGYIVRCTEKKIGKNKLVNKNVNIIKIKKSFDIPDVKIIKIIDYLDNISEAIDNKDIRFNQYCLNKRVAKYSLINFEDVRNFLFSRILFLIKLLAETDNMGYTGPESPKYIEDIVRRCLSCGNSGYLYKLAEDLLDQ